MSLRALLGNLALLLVSLILGVVIWVTAVQANDPITTLNAVQIPVEVRGQRPDVAVNSDLPETVQVSIEGPATIVNDLNLDEIQAVLDISQAPFGESEIEIDVPFQAEGVRISDPFPSQVSVELEQIVTREIPVTVNVRGNVASGYVREEPLVEPESIQVTGPASRVDQLAQAQVTIFLDNTRQTVQATPPLLFRDQSGRVIGVSGLTLSAEEVEVTIPIDELAGFAEKLITVRWTGEPASGYRLINIGVEPNSVLVTGRSVQLELLDRIRTEEVNIEGLTQPISQQVSLDLPPGVSLPEDEVQTVVVSVDIEPILTVGALLKEPELLGLEEGLEAAIDPDEVRVFLFGPLPSLDAIQPSEVRVTLDLFGLTPGEYNLEPQVDTTLEDVEIRSWQPTVLSVIITRAMTMTEGITTTAALTSTTSLPAPGTAAPLSTAPAAPTAALPERPFAPLPSSKQTIAIAL